MTTMDQKSKASRSMAVPAWVKRSLGLHTPKSAPPAYALYLWPFVGSFCALALLQAVFGHSWYFIAKGSPAIVTSYGASAVLCFDKIESPFAQPPALIGGHFVSGLIGVIISKILYGSSTLEDGAESQYVWVGASFATAFAILAMQLTRTTHPPAGATALLPILDRTANKLSWYFLPILLLSSTLLMVVAIIINNIQRKYPQFWITPKKAPQPPKTDAKPAEMAEPKTEMPTQSSDSVEQGARDEADLEAGLLREEVKK